MAAGNRQLSGIIPIPVTTFTVDGALDLTSLQRQIEFSVEAGADAVLYPGVVSEFYALTDEERLQAVKRCVDAVDGHVRVAVGVSAASTSASVMFTRQAAELGCDAVMTMVPYVQHLFAPSVEFAMEHVQAVAEAGQLPVIFQNARMGHTIGVSSLATLVAEVPQVEYVKQETNPPTQDLSAIIQTLGTAIKGAFGGIGGVYLVNELERGAVGSMPSTALADRIVQAYASYRRDGAQTCQDQLDPLGTLFTRELLYNVAFIKEVLVRRGLIATSALRVASPRLDHHDGAELDRILAAAGLA